MKFLHKRINFLLIPLKKTRDLSNLSSVTETLTSTVGRARRHLLLSFQEQNNRSRAALNLAASPFICFVPEVQVRMTTEEATIDGAHMLVTGNMKNFIVPQLDL